MSRWGPADGAHAGSRDGSRVARARSLMAERLTPIDDPTPLPNPARLVVPSSPVPRRRPSAERPSAERPEKARSEKAPKSDRAKTKSAKPATRKADRAGEHERAEKPTRVRRSKHADAPTGDAVGSDHRRRRRGRDRAHRPDRERLTRRALARRVLWGTVVVVAVSAFLGAARLPLRTFLDNQEAIAETRTQLDARRAENQRLTDEVARLDTDVELERVAREQWGYVKRGEEIYHVQQPAVDPVAVPEVWPFTELHDRLDAVDPTLGTDGSAPQDGSATTTSSTSTTRPGGATTSSIAH